jgi:hypothetical protein
MNKSYKSIFDRKFLKIYLYIYYLLKLQNKKNILNGSF